MASSSIDVAALAAAMETRVKNDRISWRTAAGGIGVSPSLLTRLRNGQRPDLEAFAAITRWLGHRADDYLVDPHRQPEGGGSQPEAPLESSVAALLRARSDLDEVDKTFLHSILVAGIQSVQQRQKAEGDR